jgi:hypothetical protein
MNQAERDRLNNHDQLEARMVELAALFRVKTAGDNSLGFYAITSLCLSHTVNISATKLYEVS